MNTSSNIQEELARFQDLLVAHPHEKRFGEKWISDPSFREAFTEDPFGTLLAHGIVIDAQDVERIIRGERSTTIERLESMRLQKETWTHYFYGTICAPDDPSWLAWRKRQISRQIFDLGPQHALTNIHSSLAIELNKGCSVGCWFCALSPERTSTPLLYAAGGKERFSTLVHAMQRELGPAVQSGFLYWATEPLDNPDYEQYCIDYHEITGVFPPTTTAIPHKHPNRIRRLLQLGFEHKSWVTRFSVLSVSLMNKVHSMFTPEELAIAECVPLNRDASFAYGVAGRYREYLKDHPEMLAEQQRRLQEAPFYNEIREHLNEDTHAHGSIACVTGFLVNLVECTISLIAPTHATDEYPLGYITFATETFSSDEGIEKALQRVVSRGRVLALNDSDGCAFVSYIRIHQEHMDLVFEGRFGTRVRAASLGSPEDVATLTTILQEGTSTQRQILERFKDNAPSISNVLKRLWNMGVLKDPIS
ncbi:MAG: radical SAM family RiPP maturation amino acid epimerase [Ignavibacteria bacterium]